MNKLFLTAIAALLVSAAVLPAAYAQTQTTVTTTTTERQHSWNPDHWQWRHGAQNPAGLFQGNNVVVIPTQVLAQNVVNNCPSSNPVLLSTGQCLTAAQALYEIQTGQIALGGQVQAQGQIIVGSPTVLQAQGYTDPFAFFHHHFHNQETQTYTETPLNSTTP